MSTATDRLDRLLRRAREPIDPGSLTVWRVAFGLLMAVAVIRFFAHGWIARFYIEPELLFPYPGFEWVAPWPGAGMYLHFAALGVLALLMAAGLWFRPAAALFCLGFTYVELLDQTHYLNHYYLVSLLAGLCALMPLGRGAAIPRWCLWVLRAQVGLVYVFAGVAKLGPDWLLDAQPLSIWLAACTDAPLVGPLLDQRWVAHAASWAGMFFDLTIVGWLSWKRTRAAALAAVVVFHVATAALFPIGLFPWLMIANAALFFGPDWPRRLLSRPRAVAPARDRAPRRVHRLALGGFALYFAVQVLVPLRAHLYPGDVLWTEEGMRFSWRVMLVEKAGVARFVVTDRGTGQRWRIYPREFLTPRQEKMMSFQPEMIRQFAHHLAAEFERRGHRDVAVSAEVYVSFNGRRSAPLIDPGVDLSAQKFSLSHASWIESGPERD